MPRTESIFSGTTRNIEFNVTYPSTWSVALKRSTAVLAAEISSARFLLKDELTSADASALVTKTTSSGISTANGIVTVTLSAADTKDLEGSYVGTLRLYLVGGGVYDFEDASYLGIPYINLSFSQGSVEAIT